MQTSFLARAAMAASLLVLVGAGCGPAASNQPPIVIQDEHIVNEHTNIPPTPPPPIEDGANGTVIKAKFATDVSLKLGETAHFTDGLDVTLKEIHDSRCPADVQCIWAGELAPVFVIKGGKETETAQIQLGTVTRLEGQSDNYVITLKEATESSVKISVKLRPADAAKATP